MARRRDGWSFLIADADDVQSLNRVAMDGETVLIQIAGELIDAAALSWAYDIVEVYRPMALSGYESLPLLLSQQGDNSEDLVCSRVGVPLKAIIQMRRLGNSEEDTKTRF